MAITFADAQPFLTQHEQDVFMRGGVVTVTIERETGEAASFMILRREEGKRSTVTRRMRKVEKYGSQRYLLR